MSRRVISFIGGKIRLHPTIGPDQTPQCLRRYLFSGRGRFGSRISKNLLPQINRRWITFIHTEGADYKKSLSYLPLKQARLFANQFVSAHNLRDRNKGDLRLFKYNRLTALLMLIEKAGAKALMWKAPQYGMIIEYGRIVAHRTPARHNLIGRRQCR